MDWYKLALFWVWLLFGLPAFASDFVKVGVKLPQHTVLSMLEDRHGKLWLGTGAGLAVYDGYQVQTFLHNPAEPHSLGQNLVLSLAETADGSIWIGHVNGLSRYRHGQGFQHYLQRQGLTEHDTSNQINRLMLDAQQRLWASGSAGAFLYQPDTDQFTAVSLPKTPTPMRVHHLRWQGDTLWLTGTFGLARLSADDIQQGILQATAVYQQHEVMDVLPLSNGRLQLAINELPVLYSKLSLVELNPATGFQPGARYPIGVTHFYCDRQQRCWGVGGPNPVRLRADGSWQVYPLQQQLDYSTSVLETRDGELLFTANRGVYRYWPAQDQLLPMTFPNDDAPEKSVKLSLLQSFDGTVWVGSHLDGLHKWAPQAAKFQWLAAPTGVAPRDANVIRAIYEDSASQSLWLGSDSGHLLQAQLPADPRLPATDWRQHQLGAAITSRINALLRLDSQQLLLATNNGLFRWQPGSLPPIDTGLLQQLPATNQPAANASAFQLNVTDIYRSGHCLWLASNAGFGCIQPDTLQVSQWYDSSRFAALRQNPLYKIYPASDGALWFTSAQGLLRFEPATQQLQQFQHEPGNTNSLSHNWVHGIWQQDAQTYWIATRDGGLNRLRWQPGQPAQWQMFAQAQGLPTNVLYGVLGTPEGKLWISSIQGIFSFDTNSHQVSLYQPEDGLQSTEFNSGVYQQGQAGRLYFGGVAGANLIVPAQVKVNPVPPRLSLAQLRVNEQQQQLSGTQALQLSHQQNHLVFDLLALHQMDPLRNQYAWQLQGVDRDWVQAGTQRQARYSALPAGSYRFIAKAANADGVWSEPIELARITVLPHPLLSPLAYALYILLLLALLWAYKHWRDRTEQQLQQKISQGIARESALAQHLRLQFEHTAHEVQTPLMRLGTHLTRSIQALQAQSSQANQAVDAPAGQPQLSQSLQTAWEAQQELQLLIERQLTAEALKLSQQPQALPALPVIQAELQRYQRYAAEKQQRLTAELCDVTVLLQPGMLELICDNLLSNAIKYTQPGGEITLRLTMATGQASPQVLLIVQDNGPGIAVTEQDKVFLRHYRQAGQQHIAGSGEGLFLVQSCLSACGGRVTLQSQPGNGCCFSVYLPAAVTTMPADCRHLQSAVTSAGTTSDAAATPAWPLPVSELLPAQSTRTPAAPTSASLPAAALNRQPGRETILIVEDHPGLRDDLYSLLSPHYQCLLAEHGAQGLALAMTELPDLVLSDLMMEQADSGFQLLAALKGHLSTCHIPVLLLTALADENNRLKGLLGQADAYLGKPASESAILAQVEVLLNQRWRLSEHIRAAMLQVATAGVAADDSSRFQAKLQGILAHLYQDPTVQIQHIASAFGKSVSVLQKLARQHLAVSLKESLRDYRLQQAKRQLIEQPTLAIEVIAEQCGFGCIRSLQRDFKQQYQITPQQYRDGHRPLTRPATKPRAVAESIE